MRRVGSGAAPGRGRWSRVVQILVIVVPVGIVGNLAFTLFGTDREVLAALGEFPRGYLALALGLAFVPWLTHTLRLTLWTRLLGHRMPLRRGFTIVLGTQLGGAVSPTALGGGVFKWALLMQRGVSPGTSASLTTLASIEDALFFLVALPLAFYWSQAWRLPVVRDMGLLIRENLPITLILLASVAVLVWITIRVIRRRDGPDRGRGGTVWTRTKQRARTALMDALDTYELIIRRGRWLLVLTFALTAIQWTARYGVITALIAFLGLPVDFVLFFLLQWVVFTLMTMIPTPGATGGAEASFFFVFGALLPGSVIGIATAGWRFLTFYVQLAVAALLFPFLYRRFTRDLEHSPGGADPPR